MDGLAALGQYPGHRTSGQPVDLQIGPLLAQLGGDRRIAQRVTKSDG